MDKLLSWLKGDRNYEAGLQLLRDNNTSSFVIEILADGPDEYNNKKLTTEIQKLVANTPGTSSLMVLDPDGDRLSDHDLEKSLRIKEIIKTLYKEIIHLRGRLPILPEGPELFNCAKSIILKNLKRQDLWDQLHYFEKNEVWFDELPENKVKEFDVRDSKQLEQKIKNLMSNRRKAAAYLEQPQPVAKKKFYENKIAGINVKIDKLKTYRQNG